MTSYDINFEKLADNFVAAYFDFRPVKGTITRLHEYDAELGSYFRSDFENEKERLRSFEHRLLTIDRNRLSKENLVDYAILENFIKGNLLDIENLRYWEKDPNYYNSIITDGVFSLIRRNFAPIQERLKKTIRREEQVVGLRDPLIFYDIGHRYTLCRH